MAANNDNYTDDTHLFTHSTEEEGIGEETDPLRLSINDTDLAEIIDKRIENIRGFYGSAEFDLYNRRKKNELYVFGRQVAQREKSGELKKYEAKNLDNVLYEIEATIKPLAMSQLPDLLVTPGQQTDEAKEIAKLLTTAVDSDVKKWENRKVLAMAFKHLPVYYVGVIKCIWNPQLYGGLGDYQFIYVHPDNIDLDYMATEPDADKMDLVPQLVHSTVQDILMKFSDKKAEILEQLKKDGIMGKEDAEPSYKALATPIDYREVWFTDYQKAGDKWERIEGVCWKYKDVILNKMKNPYFDYEGRKQVFTYDNPSLASSKRALTESEMQTSMITGQYPPNVKMEQVYNNYFEAPRKPYYFMTYDQWGKQPLDETSRVEQNIRNQDSLDKRGKQIEETLDNKGHHLWSKSGGFTAGDIQKMDHNNPNQDYLTDGDVNKEHKYIEPQRPSAQEFQDLDRIHQRMYAVSGSTAVRGEVKADTTATSNQIAREANYTRADDLVDETINPAASWMAEWALHMIKTRYTQEHFRKLLGKKGELIFMTLHQNMIDDGMEVMIKASGTDKIKKQNNAMEMARLEMTEPLSFFEDMDLDDPEGRTAKLVTFKTSLPLYLSMFVESGPTSTPELAAKLQALTQQQQAAAAPQPGGPPPTPGQPNPQQPTPTNTAQVPAQPNAAPPQASTRSI